MKKHFSLISAMLVLLAAIALSACDTFTNSSTQNNNPSYNPIDYPSNNSCMHNWDAPTCLEPAQCTKCDAYKTDGKLGDHNYHYATCQEPAKCYVCNAYKDDTLGTHKFLSDGYCLYCGISRD